MSTSLFSARLKQSAQAASRILDAEREALEAIAHCEQQMRQLASDSRALAERVRRRAETRIERMRERMQAAARLRQDRIADEMARLAALPEPDAAALAPLDQAIARTIEEIVGSAQSG